MEEWKQRVSFSGTGLHRTLRVLGGLVAVAVAAGVGTAGDGSFLRTLVGAAASVLLVGVAAASVQTGNRWRMWTRHDSIRADITAAGGLGRRLMI